MKSSKEIALDLTTAMLHHNSKVSVQIGRTSTVSEIVSAEDIAKSYLFFKKMLDTEELPNLVD